MVMWGLVIIGCVWGSTNALIKRGAQIAQRKEKERDHKAKGSSNSTPAGANTWVASFVKEWLHLLSVWEYSIPFLVNLSASVLFIRALGDSPINVAVPVTNATTFAVTAVAGAALGEQIDIWKAMVGVVMIALGIILCIVPGIIL
jgi:multidrug transporter EmrE-like cation transporter